MGEGGEVLRGAGGLERHTNSLTIQSVIERCAGAQPRSSRAALPRTRLLEPSEKVAFSRPQSALACSAGQGCADPRSRRAAIARTTSPRLSSPLSTYMNLPAGVFATASAYSAATSAICTFDQRFK